MNPRERYKLWIKECQRLGLQKSVFKWEVFIQNHVIEACPTPKAEKWGTNWFIIGIYWSQLFTRIYAEACYYSILTQWGIPLFKYTYWGMPLFLNEACHYSNTPIEACHYSKTHIEACHYSKTHIEAWHYSNTPNEACHYSHCLLFKFTKWGMSLFKNI